MKTVASWPVPEIPEVAGAGAPVSLFDSAAGAVVPVQPTDVARLYVCGITPYDATHLGHAATYLAFDTLGRAWRDAGIEVRYSQNITDVDDPLFERATATGRDWRELAEEQTDLFRSDMAALRIIPPDDYVRVQDVIDETADFVVRMVENGTAYRVPIADDADPRPVDAAATDVYFDVEAAQRDSSWRLGRVSGFDPERLRAAFVEFGGDPDRPGKRNALDPLLWRAARTGEPAWPTPLGPGRPGWHVECSVIATGTLGTDITVQAGGRDLVFPHHDLSAGHATAVTHETFAHHFAHAGLVAYDGTKMSKSLGNLVLVSKLTAAGRDPAAIRLTILANHYRSDWSWTDALLVAAEERLDRWRAHAAAVREAGDAIRRPEESAVVTRIRAAVADDLDTPTAVAIVDEWANGSNDATVPAIVDALLGISL